MKMFYNNTERDNIIDTITVYLMKGIDTNTIYIYDTVLIIKSIKKISFTYKLLTHKFGLMLWTIAC